MMNFRTIRTLVAAVAALLFFSDISEATQQRKVSGYVVDTARPGLKRPVEFNLDAATENGTVPQANTGTIAVLEEGNPFIHQSTFTLTASSATITDATTAGAHGGIQLYDFPQGLIYLFGVSSDLAITAGAGGIGDTASVICSLGSIVTATDNEALTSTEADFGASTAATLTGGVGACDIDGTTALIAILNGSATAKDLFLNFAVPDAGSSASDTIAVTGTVIVTWAQLGDN